MLREPHVRILWASWHVVSVFGLVLAALLVHRAYSPGPGWEPPAIGVAMLAASLIVGLGTKGKHIGWVGLLVVAVLTGLGFGLA